MQKSESFTITGETLYVTTKASVHDAVSDLIMMLYVDMLLLPINADGGFSGHRMAQILDSDRQSDLFILLALTIAGCLWFEIACAQGPNYSFLQSLNCDPFALIWGRPNCPFINYKNLHVNSCVVFVTCTSHLFIKLYCIIEIILSPN